MLGYGMTRGIAIGNELELLQFKQNISTDCIHRMWTGGYFFRKLSERAADLDGLEPSTRDQGGEGGGLQMSVSDHCGSFSIFLSCPAHPHLGLVGGKNTA